MARLSFIYLSDTVLEVGNGGTPLQKRISGTAITSGTMTATIWNAEVDPMTQITSSPLSLAHQGTPDGYWSVNIDDDFESGALTKGLHCQVRLTLDGGAGFMLYMEVEAIVEVYRGDS